MRKRMRLFLTSCLIATVFASLQMFSRPATAQEPYVWKVWISQSGCNAQAEGWFLSDNTKASEEFGYPEDLICYDSYAYQHVDDWYIIPPNGVVYWIRFDWDKDGVWDEILWDEYVSFTGDSWSKTYTHSPETVTIGGDEVEPSGPRCDNMLIHVYTSQDAVCAALEDCTLDISDVQLTKNWIDKWTSNPSIQMKDYAKLEIFDFDLNNQRWPTGVTLPREFDPATGTYKHYMGTSEWDDEAASFRKAIAYLTDKDMYISEILKGYGYRIDSKVPVPALAGYIPPNLPIYYYDPCAAAAEFDANGFVQGSTPNPYYDPAFPCSAQYIRTDPRYGGDLAPLQFYIRIDEPTKMQAGIHLTDNLRKAGIPVNQYIVEKSVCYEKVMIEYDYHIYTSNFDVGIDIDYLEWLFHSQMYYGGTETSYYDGVGWSPNYIGFCNHEYDYWAEELSYATDVMDVKEAAFKCQIVFAEEVGSIPVWTRHGVKAYKTGWDGVVNMEGYGIDNRWSFLNMNKTVARAINYGISTNLESLNVITAQWPKDLKILDQIYDSLIGLNPFNFAEEYGWLAESWETGEWEPGKMYILFTIVPDAVFHDGSPVTAEDVKFSLEFTRDCGPGVAWNYGDVKDIDHVDTQAEDPSLGPLDVKVYFTCASYWALHWAGGLPIINKDLWMAANDVYGWGYGTPDWNPWLVRDYHPWNDDVNSNGIIDLCEDGAGPWKYDSTDLPGAISASTWVLLTANRDYYKSQTDISDYLRMAFHAIGDIDYDGDIDIVDLYIIARSLGTDDTYPHGTGWDEYNPEADIYTCISWPEWILGDGMVRLTDLTTAAMNYGRTIDC